jgi:hypothetical protein
MPARIGVMRALNRHVERVFNPERKDIHWGNGSLSATNDRVIIPEEVNSFAPLR